MTENTAIALTLLPPADRAAIVLDATKTEARLRDLVQETADIHAVIDPAGREQAHRAGMKLKNTRTAIEKTGKAARDDANAFSKAVIAEEKKLIAIIEGEERRVLGLRDAYDAKVAAEKAESERKERERITAIQTKIDAIRQIPATMAGEPSEEIAIEIGALSQFAPGSEFAEFKEDAVAAARSALESLASLHERAVAQEQEAARVAAERAELDRQRKEREAEEARLAAERQQFEDERRAFMMQQAQARRAEEERQAKDASKVVETIDLGVIPAGTTVTQDVITDLLSKAGSHFSGVNIDRAHDAAGQVSADIAALASVSGDPEALIEACLSVSTEPDDSAAVQHFRDIVAELLNTRTADEIRFLLEEELAKVGLSQWRAA